MESIRGYFKALKWRSLIVAFSAILLGLLFILTPQASADVICYVAGILLLASGIAAVISYLASGRLFGSYALVSGIVLLVCGVFCLLRPEIIQGLLTVLFGVFLVIDGMMTLQDGVDCARARLAGWWVPALLGAVTIALGCVVLFGKFDSIMLLAGMPSSAPTFASAAPLCTPGFITSTQFLPATATENAPPLPVWNAP